MALNLHVTFLYHLAKGHLRQGTYEAYAEMAAMSMESVKRFIAGWDGSCLIRGQAKTFNDMMRSFYEAIKALWMVGNNLLVTGADVLALRPYKFDWEADHLQMFSPAGCKFRELEGGAHRNFGVVYIPACTDATLWELADEIWEENTGCQDWGLDQYILNRMYYAQGLSEWHHQDDLRPWLNHSLYLNHICSLLQDDPQIVFEHYHVTRDPSQVLYRMRSDWKDAQEAYEG